MAVTVVALGALGLAAAASAATPHKLGDGAQVKVAVSPNGTAHVVWVASDPTRYVYCRVPLGAVSCDRTHEWTSPSGGTIGYPAGVFALSDSLIVISQYFCCFTETWVVGSNDGGQSFSAQALLADDTAARAGDGESVYGPGNAITAVEGNTATFGPYVQSSPLGAVNSTSTSALSSYGMVGDSSLGFLGAAAVLAWVTEENGGMVRYRVAATANDLNQDASWGPMQVADLNADWTDQLEIASGPSGLFLLYSRNDEGGSPLVRRWDGSGFGPATKLADDGIFAELHQDPGGRLHAVWTKAAFGTPRGPLMYRQSADGSSWGPATVLVEGVDPANAQPAANESGEGVIAYDRFDEVFFARMETASPPPTVGRTANVEPVRGTVRTKCRGDRRFTELEAAEQIPVGCLVDTREGTVRLTSSRGRVGGTQSGQFRQGLFRVRQKAARRPFTVLALAGRLACGQRQNRLAGPLDSSSLAETARRKRRGGRRLWGKGRGRFRTKGRRGAANVRGTTWLVADRCNGSTLFRVRKGRVRVRDFAKRKTVTLRKGQRYVATGRRR